MTEKVQIGNKDVWIAVEPLAVHRQSAHIIPTEYFVAYYSTKEPDGDLGEMFKESDNRPKLFLSPVEALEYAYEHLVGKV